MDEFIEVMDADGLADGEMHEVKVEGHDLLVVLIDGEPLVSDARCPHLGGPLFKGELTGTVVRCPWHHSEFDLRDGRVVQWTDWSGAAKSMATMVRHPRPLRVYEAKIADGKVWVGPQKPTPA